MNPEEIGKKVKAKYPQYKDISDKEVGDKTLVKYPQYGTPTPEKESPLKSIVKSIVSPVATIAARPIQLAAELGGVSPETLDRFSKEKLGGFVAPVPQSGRDVVKDIGRGIETVSFGLGGAAVKGAVQTGLKSTLKTAVKKSAKEGIKIGATGGFGAGLSREGEVSDALLGAGIGAAGGAVLGGAIPVASRAVGETVSLGRKGFGKASSVLESRVAQREASRLEREALLKAGAPDARVAGEKLVGKEVVKDRVAQEAIKQGVPEADVALIKSSSKTDTSKMLKMLDIRKSQMTNRRTTARATDVVGDTFLNQAKYIAKVNKEAGKQLDVVARRLSGKKVDSTNALTAFAEDLNNAGVNINKKGMLDFRGSNFEGISTAQSSIQNVWSRAVRVAKDGDALQHHRVKSFIDEIVDYGKKAEGLSGKVQNILKGYRRNVDQTLDTKFAQYNKVNTVFADTISELNKINQSMGLKFRLGDSFADARAGVTMRRILSNTQSRSDILQLLESMQGVAKKYGLKIDDDIVAQINFADLLERLLKSEAPTSFLGQIERGAQAASDIGGVTSAFGRGKFLEGGTRAVVAGIRQARGISQENQIKALEALLRSGGIGKSSPTKAVSVFGRPIKK